MNKKIIEIKDLVKIYNLSEEVSVKAHQPPEAICLTGLMDQL